MKKEVVLAIVIGFGIGLLITFGIYTARTAISPTTSPTPTSSVNPSPESTSSASISITSPIDYSLVNTETISIQGTTLANAVVTVIGEDATDMTIASNEGKFNLSIKLSGGANNLTITAFSPTGERAETILTITFSTAEI